MSRGPGRIERAIKAIFAAAPNNAFTTHEVCERVFPNSNCVEHKHRVAVGRAAKKVASRMDGWSWLYGEKLGRTMVFFNSYDVMSYALARLKTGHYRSKDPRVADCWRQTKEADLRARLAEGGRDHHLVVEGGAWWCYVQQRIAERENKMERSKEMSISRAGPQRLEHSPTSAE